MPFGLKKDLAHGDKIQFDRVYSRIIHCCGARARRTPSTSAS